MPQTYEPLCGAYIDGACKALLDLAVRYNDTAVMAFNGISVKAHADDSLEQVLERYHSATAAREEAYKASPEGKAAEAARLVQAQKEAAREAAGAVHNEDVLRDAKPPRCESVEDLTAYITSLVNGKHDYGTCAYAMALAAQAAFEYVARELGTTGFQASCADLSFLGKVRGLKGPFVLLKAEDALYPQHNLHRKLQEALDDWKPWLKEEAAKRLADRAGAHPDVIAHWEKLAGEQ